MSTPDPRRMWILSTLYVESSVLHTAAELDLFSDISELGSSDVETLAKRKNLDRRGLQLLLDACVAVGLLTKEVDQYRNSTDAEAYLVNSKPLNQLKMVSWFKGYVQNWAKLTDFVRTGKPVVKPELHLGESKEVTRAFVYLMHSRALTLGQDEVRHLDMRGRKRLLDVGGCGGTYAIVLAQANPDLQAIVFDLPGVVEVADELITQAGLQERVKTMPGDMHRTPFPGEQDVIHFFGVLHQASTDQIKQQLRKAYDSLVPGGVLRVSDWMTDATRTSPKLSALWSIMMAIHTHHGWVFSDADVRSWVSEAGFKDITIAPMNPKPHWLLTAYRPA